MTIRYPLARQKMYRHLLGHGLTPDEAATEAEKVPAFEKDFTPATEDNLKHARPDYARIQDPAGLIPAEEPVFLLRGQDFFAPMTLHYYADLLHAKADRLLRDNPNSPEARAKAQKLAAVAEAADLQASAMDSWQQQVRGKNPDLPEPGADPTQQVPAIIDQLLTVPPGDPRLAEMADLITTNGITAGVLELTITDAEALNLTGDQIAAKLKAAGFDLKRPITCCVNSGKIEPASGTVIGPGFTVYRQVKH